MLRNDVFDVIKIVNELVRLILIQLLLKDLILKIFFDPIC